MTNRARWRIPAIIILVLALGIVAAVVFRPARKRKFRTALVARGEILSQVSATGTLNPTSAVTVGSQVSGRLDTVLVDYNDHVTAGQILARIDPRNYQAALQQAAANLRSAQVSLTQAERSLRNAESLAKAGLISDDQLLGTRTEYEQSAIRVAQAQANYDQAATNLAYTTIRSPMTGIVIARKVQKGQTVAASLQSPELFSIADLSRMHVEVAIQEADVGKLDTGMLATFKVDAYPDREFQGRLVQIRNEPVVNQNVVTYVGIVQVPTPDLALKPGMTADVKIEVVRVTDVLTVPTSALNARLASQLGAFTARPDARPLRPAALVRAPDSATGRGRGRRVSETVSPDAHLPLASPVSESTRRIAPRARIRTVYVLEQGRPVPRPVEIGVSDSYNTEVRSGLKEGETVVIGLDQGRVNPFAQSGAGPPPGFFR
ncbi:MAG: efflux RND transporter periplasmic adaptor subunit [candidate division WOR-3 bacterium]